MVSPRKVLRRMARWLSWALGTLLLIALLLLIFLHTGWGRDYVRAQIASGVTDAIPGSLTIEKLEGSLLGQPRLRNVGLVDSRGEQVLSIERLDLDMSLLALLNDEVAITQLDISGAHLNLKSDAAGNLNLIQSLVDPNAEEEEKEGWPVHLRGIRLNESSLTYTDAEGKATTLEDLSADDLSVSSRHGRTDIFLSSLGATLPFCGGRRIEIGGDIHFSPEGIRSTELTISSGQSEVRLRNLAISENPPSMRAEVEGKLAPALLRCLAPPLQWQSAIAFQGEANQGIDDDAISFALRVNEGALRIESGRIANDFGQASAVLHLEDFEPHTLVQIGTDIRATGRFELEADSLAPENLQAEVRGRLQAQVDGAPFEISELALVNQGKLASLAMSVKANASTASTSVKLDWGQSTPTITEGTVRAKVPRLADLPLKLPLKGGVELVETSVEGPIHSLHVQGKLIGTGLAYDTSRASQAKLEFDFKDLPSSLKGKVHLRAQGLWQGRESIGPLRAEFDSDHQGRIFKLSLRAGHTKRLWAQLEAKAERGATKTVIHLNRLQLRHQAIRTKLRARPSKQARVTLWNHGDVAIEDLRLALNGGTVDIEGSLDRQLKAKIQQVRIAPLLKLVPALPLPITGVFSGSASLKQSEAGPTATVSLKTPALRLTESSEALRAELTGSMSPRELAASVSLQSDDQGSLQFRASIQPPKGRWTHKASRLLRSSRLEFSHFDLRLVRALHEELASLGGQVSGAIELGAGVAKIDGTLSATNLVHDRWTTKRQGSIEIHATRRLATLAIALQDSDIGGATLNLKFVPPGPLHSPWLWPPGLDGVLRDSDLVFDDLDLVALQTAVPLLQSEELPVEAGTLWGEIHLREKGRELSMQASALDLQLAGRPKLSARVDTTLEPNATSLSWEVTLDTKNSFRGDAKWNAGFSLLEFRHDKARLLRHLERARLQGSATLRNNSPALLASVLGVSNDIEVKGRIAAKGVFDGTIANPAGSLHLAIVDASVDGVRLQSASFTGEMQRSGAKVALRVHQSRKRYLSADLDLDLDRERVRSSEIEAKDIDLRLLRALDESGEGVLASIAGVANADLEITGDWNQLEPIGSLRIRDGAIDLGGGLMPIIGIALDLTAKDQRLNLSGKAKSGSGRIEVSGGAKVQGGGLEDIGLRLRSTRLPVAVGALVYSIDLDAHNQISLKPGLLDIRTNIDSALIRVPIRSFLSDTRSLHRIDGMNDLVYVSPAEDAGTLEVDPEGTMARIRIRAKESVNVQSREIRAQVDLDLTTTVVGDVVATSGVARIVQGHVDLLERRYTIDRASATFRGRIPMNPSFDLKLRHDFDLLSLVILAQGTLEDPNLNFLADPPEYDQATLLAIVLGQAPAQNENQQGLRNNALSALSTFAANKLQDALAPVLPVDLDVLRVEKTENDGELYTAGVWINDNWFLAYHHRTLAEDLENTNEGESKYKLSKDWALEGVYGDGGAGGLDVLWTKRWGK